MKQLFWHPSEKEKAQPEIEINIETEIWGSAAPLYEERYTFKLDALLS
ncbi:MAG: hypothetical protein WAT12_17375 [Candidatus Nitrotoga sp.]